MENIYFLGSILILASIFLLFLMIVIPLIPFKRKVSRKYKYLFSRIEGFQLDDMQVKINKSDDGFFYNYTVIEFRVNELNKNLALYIRYMINDCQKIFDTLEDYDSLGYMRTMVHLISNNGIEEQEDKFGYIERYSTTCTYTIDFCDIMKINESNLNDEELLNLFTEKSVRKKEGPKMTSIKS